MKNFVIAVFAIVFFLIGLLATMLEVVGLLDPEGYHLPTLYFFGIVAIFSFPISYFLWKLSRQK